MLPPPAPQPVALPPPPPLPNYADPNPPAPPVDQEQLAKDIAEWETLQVWIADAKVKEMALRKSIADRTFGHLKTPAGLLPSGTQRAEVGGYPLKMVGKINRVILVEQVAPVTAELAKLTDKAADLVKVKHELSWSTYKTLTDDQKKIADRLFIEKQGTIELEIEHGKPAA